MTKLRRRILKLMENPVSRNWLLDLYKIPKGHRFTGNYQKQVIIIPDEIINELKLNTPPYKIILELPVFEKKPGIRKNLIPWIRNFLNF